MEAQEKTIDKLVRRIVEEVHPIRIILFGSAARGKVEEDSDIDLLAALLFEAPHYIPNDGLDGSGGQYIQILGRHRSVPPILEHSGHNRSCSYSSSTHRRRQT
jgi:hypothetical protein